MAGQRGARVTTRTGDRGDTSLFGKERVRKSDPRIDALGDLDEAQAALGVARAQASGAVAETILELQRGLYVAMAEVATPRDDLPRLHERIDEVAVAAIDERAAALRATADIEGRFVIPGEDPLGAALDLARTVVRRAERRVVSLADAGTVDGTHLVPWMNRLSDVVFVLARSVEPRKRPASAR
ncbi:MAG TPA: cob(I)yrinic acid a,c-diamide adenosyltransferase [Candidatus Limnocylindria bacterium]|nr:cob(I)yrinic acid a,c-diamide adenosyltransferase [Candidatus Limnocylindria bacterium]